MTQREIECRTSSRNTPSSRLISLIACVLAIGVVGTMLFQQDFSDVVAAAQIKIQPKDQPDEAQTDKPQLPKIIPAPKVTPDPQTGEFISPPSDEDLNSIVKKVGESLGWALVYEKPAEGLFIWRLKLAGCALPDVASASQTCDGRMVWLVKRSGDSLAIWNPLWLTHPMEVSESQLGDDLSDLEKSLRFLGLESRIMQEEYIQRFQEMIGHVRLRLLEEFPDELRLYKDRIDTAMRQTQELKELPIVLNDIVIVIKDQAALSRDGKIVQTIPRGWTLIVRGFDKDELKVFYRRPGVVERSDVLPLKDGIELFTEEIAKDPRNSDAYTARGTAWMANGDYTKAISDLNRALELNPKDCFAYQSRGMAQEFQLNYQSAVSDYTSALKLKPEQAYLLTDRSAAYLQLGELDRAWSDANAAIKLDPQYSVAFNNRGLAWQRMERPSKALSDFNEAIRLDPEFALGYLNRAKYWESQEKWEKFKEDLGTAISLNPAYLTVLYDVLSQMPEE